MKALVTGLVIFFSSVFFVNVMLFGILRIPSSKIPLGSLLTIEAVFAGFFLFLFLINRKKI